MPQEYTELLDYIREYERVDYIRLCTQLNAGSISEDLFNSQHDILFKRLRKRKQECLDMMIWKLPPKFHHVMNDYQRKEYYEMIVCFQRGMVTLDEFNDYHLETLKNLRWKVENAEANDRIMKSLDNGDHIALKLAGARHSNTEQFHVRYKGKGKWERYTIRDGKEADHKDVSTFYEI